MVRWKWLNGLVSMGFTALSGWVPDTVWRGLPELQCMEGTTRHIHATFGIHYVVALSKVGNMHSFRYFGINLLNGDNVTCYPYRGGLIMIWKADKSTFLECYSHSFSFQVNRQFWFTVCCLLQLGMFTRFESSKRYLVHPSASMGFTSTSLGATAFDYHSYCFQFNMNSFLRCETHQRSHKFNYNISHDCVTGLHRSF